MYCYYCESSYYFAARTAFVALPQGVVLAHKCPVMHSEGSHFSPLVFLPFDVLAFFFCRLQLCCLFFSLLIKLLSKENQYLLASYLIWTQWEGRGRFLSESRNDSVYSQLIVILLCSNHWRAWNKEGIECDYYPRTHQSQWIQSARKIRYKVISCCNCCGMGIKLNFLKKI